MNIKLSSLNSTGNIPTTILLLCLVLCMTSCSSDNPDYSGEYIPQAPDYSDHKMWVTYLNDDKGNGADLFYIPSTWEFDYTTADGKICHYADPSLDAHRADMKIEIDGIAEYMAPGNNFFSPYYRHITLDTWATLNEDIINRRYSEVSFTDIRGAAPDFVNASP